MYNRWVRTKTRTAALLLALAGVACAGPRPVSWDQVRPPEAYVETLPGSALVSVNGKEVGKAPVSFPVPGESADFEIRVEAPGFETTTFTEKGGKLAGTRLDVVLRPEGFGSQRRLSLGDAVGLAQAAAALLRANRPTEALAFAQASLAAGESPQAHRSAGEAYRRMGNRNMAVKEFSLYLSLAPDAPDRKAIEQAIASSRKDIDMTAPKPALE